MFGVGFWFGFRGARHVLGNVRCMLVNLFVEVLEGEIASIYSRNGVALRTH